MNSPQRQPQGQPEVQQCRQEQDAGHGAQVPAVPAVPAAPDGPDGPVGAAGAAGPECLPPGALHLRTQPDDIQWTNQWTNLHDADMAPADSLPETQLVQQGSAQQVVPDTEEEAVDPLLQPQEDPPQQQQQQEADPAAAGAGEQAEEADAAAAEAAGVESEEEEGSDSEEEAPDEDRQLAARFKHCKIRGAKSVADDVELYVQWESGERETVTAARLHSLAQDDCPGCWALGKLAHYYESKTRRAKKSGG